MASLNHKLFEQDVLDQRARLILSEQGVVKPINQRLAKLFQAWRKELLEAVKHPGLAVSETSLSEMRRRASILAKLGRLTGQALSDVQKYLAPKVVGVYRNEIYRQSFLYNNNLVKAAGAAAINFGGLSERAARAALEQSKLPGIDLVRGFEKISKNTMARMRRDVAESIAGGWSVDRLASRWESGLGAGVLRNDLDSLAITALHSSANAASVSLYKENPHLVAGVRWDATFDSRTCFPADTLVTTSRGNVPIQDVVVGDHVLTHRGRWQPVTGLTRRVYRGYGSEITAGGRTLLTTFDHPVWQVGRGWVAAASIAGGERVVQLVGGLASLDLALPQSNHRNPPAAEFVVLGPVAGSGGGLPVPVVPVRLDNNAEGRDEEVARHSPDRPLADELHALGSEKVGDDFLQSTYAAMLAVAGEPAKPLRVGLARRRSEAAAALAARNKDRRAATEFGAVFQPTTSWVHRASTTPAQDPLAGLRYASGAPAESPGLAVTDREPLPAPAPLLGDGKPGVARAATEHPGARDSSPAEHLPAGPARLHGGQLRHAPIMASVPVASNAPVMLDETVYCLIVAEDESFLANGFVVHNCIVCAGLHGRVWPVDDAPACPAHFRCRCTLLPVFLDDAVDKQARSLRAYRVGSAVAFKKGDAQFESWLGGLSAPEQRGFFPSLLKFQAWKEGVPLSMLAGPEGTLTDPEVRDLLDSKWKKRAADLAAAEKVRTVAVLQTAAANSEAYYAGAAKAQVEKEFDTEDFGFVIDDHGNLLSDASAMYAVGGNLAAEQLAPPNKEAIAHIVGKLTSKPLEKFETFASIPADGYSIRLPKFASQQLKDLSAEQLFNLGFQPVPKDFSGLAFADEKLLAYNDPAAYKHYRQHFAVYKKNIELVKKIDADPAKYLKGVVPSVEKSGPLPASVDVGGAKPAVGSTADLVAKAKASLPPKQESPGEIKEKVLSYFDSMESPIKQPYATLADIEHHSPGLLEKLKNEDPSAYDDIVAVSKHNEKAAKEFKASVAKAIENVEPVQNVSHALTFEAWMPEQHKALQVKIAAKKAAEDAAALKAAEEAAAHAIAKAAAEAKSAQLAAMAKAEDTAAAALSGTPVEHLAKKTIFIEPKQFQQFSDVPAGYTVRLPKSAIPELKALSQEQLFNLGFNPIPDNFSGLSFAEDKLLKQHAPKSFANYNEIHKLYKENQSLAKKIAADPSAYGLSAASAPAAVADTMAGPLVPKSAPVPPAPSLVADVPKGEIVKVDGWKKVGTQQGSNPGGTYLDPKGRQWYVKTYADEQQAKNEILAARLYEAAGVNVPEFRLATLDGKTSTASPTMKLDKGEHLLTSVSRPSGLDEGFAVDAWLANWDVVGASYDNIGIDSAGRAYRIDLGGSLLYRAKAGLKGDKFTDAVGELETFVSSKNPQSSAVFGDINPAKVVEGIDRVLAIGNAQIEKMVADAGLDPSLAAKLIARRESLRGLRAKYVSKIAAWQQENAAKVAAKLEAEKAAKIAEAKALEASKLAEARTRQITEQFSLTLDEDAAAIAARNADRSLSSASRQSQIFNASGGMMGQAAQAQLKLVRGGKESSMHPDNVFMTIHNYAGSSYRNLRSAASRGWYEPSVKRSASEVAKDAARMDSLAEFMKNLPTLDGITYRCFGDVTEKKYLDALLNGDVIDFKAPTSASTSAVISSGFLHASRGDGFIFRIRSRNTGVPLFAQQLNGAAESLGLSTDTGEQEVLMKRGSRFRVLSRTRFQQKNPNGNSALQPFGSRVNLGDNASIDLTYHAAGNQNIWVIDLVEESIAKEYEATHKPLVFASNK